MKENYLLKYELNGIVHKYSLSADSFEAAEKMGHQICLFFNWKYISIVSTK